jgi:segregation and condensation protein A
LSLHVQIERFEGPLALLLHLIRKEEMDIFDINIHEITKGYFEYIKTMKQLDLELAGDFVAMAATLIQIKARMLLPQYNEEGEVIESEDPRKELVQKLLEYQKFQDVSQRLYERPLVGRDVWVRGQRLKLESGKEEEIVIEEDNTLFALIKSYRIAVKNMKKSVHRVMQELQSIASRVMEIKDRLVVGQRVVMNDLLDHSLPRQMEYDSNGNLIVRKTFADQVLVTFLSLLELSKMGFVSVFQSESFGDIHVEAKRPIERNVIERVEDYEKSEDHILGDLDIPDESALQVEASSIDELEDVVQQSLPLNEESEEGPLEMGSSALIEAATDEEIFEEEQRLQLDQEAGVETSGESFSGDVPLEKTVEDDGEVV